MLILKGKFPFFNLFPLLLALLLAAGSPAQAAEAKAGAVAPDVVAAEFYGWYLEALSADQDPLSDRYDTFTRYVTRELAARLVERLQGGRLPQRDYFTQSTGYRPAWQRSVHAATMRRRAAAADVVVTLGGGETGEDHGPRQVLALSMVLENGSWKIRQVVSVDASRSSAEQPAI
ncbi:DUF3828 domain-containing protein [Massilia sp. 2TAF26]|uniref:DUF3828 domain-containing protein n=1 Tax=Massilia sp. 2TAF26 TaxID=3233012 RepID=UPI003F991862